jgi:ABC-type glycerol-3-phosphate transport system substrate-binding protein
MKLSLFQGIILAVFGIAALLGLFVFATYTNSSAGSATSKIGTVTIWGTLPEADMTAALAAATQIDSALKGVSYTQHDPTTFTSDLTAAIATGQAPDLILISQEQLESLTSIIEPIAPATLSAKSFESAFTTESQLFLAPGTTGAYGVPFLVDPLVMFTNQSILASSGIAVAPTTWEALTGLVPEVAQTTSNESISRALIALGTYDNVHDARGILSALFLQTSVPLSERTTTGLSADLGTGTSVNGVPAGDAVLRFYTQFADPTKVSYTWNTALPDSQQAFINGDLALYLGYASEARYISQANPNLDYQVSPLPQPATATLKTTYGFDYAFAIPRGAANASGAFQAAAILTGSAEQQAAANATGLAPAARAALATVPADPTLATAYSSALYASGWLSPAPADTDTIFSSMINNVTSGRTTLDFALTSAQQSLNALLQ